MALLLHLSDLHLTSGTTDNLGDDKARILRPEQAQSRRRKMKDSLRELDEALRNAGQTLDSIVITGDITSFGEPEGFDYLPEILAGLGKSLPPKDRILVVPGNHDVVKGTPSGSEQRYERFVKIRANGYRTAYLEGVDLDDDRTVRPGPRLPPVITAIDGSFVLVGLNSANNCWVPDNRYSGLADQVDIVRKSRMSAGVQGLIELIDLGEATDMARVDQTQLTTATALLSEASPAGSGVPLRIVALHHQIAPVSSTEEVKEFESITNLGAFRQWLAGSEIGLVLHGHKHKGAALVESYTPTQSEEREPHVLLVLGAPSLQREREDVFGRLLDIRTASLGIGGIYIADVPARDEGVGYELSALKQRYLALDRSAELGLIADKTAGDVYRRVLAQRGRLMGLPSPLVCRIENGPSALAVPDQYPDIPAGADPQEWFETTVAWWQRRTKGKAAEFNHGERLFRKSSDRRDRIDRIVDELKKKEGTSRAIALLIDGSGDLDHTDTEYPAFISVQFVIEDKKLNLIAYYRKQEMPHWWPINVGELARLQREVLTRMGEDRGVVSAGSIATVTAMPVNGVGVPRVAVPWIDRIADSDENLLPLVLPLLRSSVSESRNGVKDMWERVTSDWVPGPDRPTDGDPVPVLGLRRLQAVLTTTASVGMDDRPELTALSAGLGALADANIVYIGATTSDKSAARKAWADKVHAASAQIAASVSILLADADG